MLVDHTQARNKLIQVWAFEQGGHSSADALVSYNANFNKADILVVAFWFRHV